MENSEYKLNKADDEAAVELITKAKEVLEGFYGDKGAAASALLQKRQPEEQTGATCETNGIVAITMIRAEVEMDIAKADAEEKNAQEEYDNFKADIEESILTLKTSITDMEIF